MDKKITKEDILKIDSCFKINKTYMFNILLIDNTIYPERHSFLTLKDVDDDIGDIVKKFYIEHGDIFSNNMSRGMIRRFKIQQKGYKC